MAGHFGLVHLWHKAGGVVFELFDEHAILGDFTQGLTVCRNCGYAYYGKTAPRSRKYDPTNILRYYRCIGADGYRFNGKAVCNNGPVRSDQLEQIVWDQVRALLERFPLDMGHHVYPACRK